MRTLVARHQKHAEQASPRVRPLDGSIADIFSAHDERCAASQRAILAYCQKTLPQADAMMWGRFRLMPRAMSGRKMLRLASSAARGSSK